MKTKAFVVVGFFLVLTAVFLYGNINVKRGGILDNAIMNVNDPYYKMDKYVQALTKQGLDTGEQVALAIKFSDQEISVEDLRFILSFTDKLRAEFPEIGILSLSNTARYKDTADELLNLPYLTEDVLLAENFNPRQWQAEISKDLNVWGLLVGKDYAQVILFVPRATDEVTFFWHIVEFLEGKKIPLWQKYVKIDIYPKEEFKRVLPLGWLMGRGNTDSGLTCDVLMYSVVGNIFAFFCFLVSFSSLRQAFIGLIVINVGLIWARGSLGILQIFGFEFYERVYFLLVFTVELVAANSFVVHKFSRYNELRLQNSSWMSANLWKHATDVHVPIIFTAIIAIVNFATLYQIGARGIMEVGILAALGVFEVAILSLYFLPALHILIGGESNNKGLGTINNRWQKFLDAMIILIVAFLQKYQNKSAKIVLSAIIAIVAIAGLCVWQLGINCSTMPLEYIKDTRVYAGAEFMRGEGRYGFDRISFLIEPKDGNIYSPQFFNDIMSLKDRLKDTKGFREANSIMDAVSVILRESYNDLELSEQAIYDAVQMVSWDLQPQVLSQLWFEGGIVMFASTDTMDNSNAMGESCDAIVAMNDIFSRLKIRPFGKVPTYPRVDRYIREGKPLNLLTSQFLVVLMYVLFIFVKNYKKPRIKQLRVWRTSFVMSAPFVFATACIAIIMAVFKIPLDQANACITALAINAAADFGLYIMVSFEDFLSNDIILFGDKKNIAAILAIQDKGKEVLTDLIVNCCNFAPLMLSVFLPIQRLGWIMIVMLLACGFGSLVLIPALLPWCVKKQTER